VNTLHQCHILIAWSSLIVWRFYCCSLFTSNSLISVVLNTALRILILQIIVSREAVVFAELAAVVVVPVVVVVVFDVIEECREVKRMVNVATCFL